MKKLLSIFLFSFLLSNCSGVAVIGGTTLSSSYVVSDIKMLFDVVSLVETGKTTNDHVLSNYTPTAKDIQKRTLYQMDEQSRTSKYIATAKDIQKEKLSMFIHIFN